MASAPYTPQRPMITANQVTFLRIVFMPVVAWLIYRGGHAAWWWAIVLGSLVAMTDFVDGYLARKHGPTVFGGLLDPIADKIFLALVYVPLADLGILPAWAVALMFVREFLVTALRSSFAQRDMVLKPNYLAKFKTWVQMQLMAFVLLALVVDRDLMLAIWIGSVPAPLLALAAYWLKTRKLWRGAWVMAVSQAVGLAVFGIPETVATSLDIAAYCVVALTWISAFDYVVMAFPRLRRAGDFSRADAVRIASAVLLPCLAFAALVMTDAHVVPLAAVIAIELTVGGLDNLLSHHRVAAGATAWALRTLGASLLLALAIAAPRLGIAGAVDPLAIAALVVSAVGVGREFWRGRAHYLTALN